MCQQTRLLANSNQLMPCFFEDYTMHHHLGTKPVGAMVRSRSVVLKVKFQSPLKDKQHVNSRSIKLLLCTIAYFHLHSLAVNRSILYLQNKLCDDKQIWRPLILKELDDVLCISPPPPPPPPPPIFPSLS